MAVDAERRGVDSRLRGNDEKVIRNMPRFFSVSANSVYTRGFPWISSLTQGFGVTYVCRTEGRSLSYATGKMVALLERDKGVKWPDVLGCGAFPFLIVSERVKEAWDREEIGAFSMEQVEIAGPLPRKLMGTAPPQYFWIDGARLRGALIDFEASGFVGVRFCPECGTRTDNIPETFRLQYAPGARFSFVFREDTWNGLNLFTTDIADTKFFCTEAVVQCARKHKLTNFRFVPIEDGHAIGSRGLDYM
jgi:hypothetical protein